MAGKIILRDLWKDFILCDGNKVEIQGGFRGFKNVPPGTHTVENHNVTLDLKPGEVQIHVLDSENKVFRVVLEDDDPEYYELATSGAMDRALKDWPTAK